MNRSRLKYIYIYIYTYIYIYICKRNGKNMENYRKQINFCVDPLHKTKTEYFKNLNAKDLFDNRKFWKTIKPYFSNKD